MEYSIFHPENVNIRNRPKSMMAHAEVEFGLSRFQFHALLRSGEPLISYISWYITFNLARLIPSHWHSSRSSHQPALSILVCTSLYCHHHRQGRSLCQNMWTMSLSKNASTHFSAQISCKGPILLFRMISVKPTWPRGQFGGTLYSIEIKGS